MASDPVDFTLRFPDAHLHLVDIEARYGAHHAAGPDGSLELMMPVWTPGSYLVREFARHVVELEAQSASGEPLEAVKVNKNRWRVGGVGAGGEDVVVRYRLYCRELTVRTNFVDPGFALLNGAPTFLVPATPDGPLDAAYRLRFEPREGWDVVAVALPAAGDGPVFRAEDLDTLVDSPVYLGSGSVHDFSVDGVEHRVVHEGAGGVWDGAATAADVETIVEAQRRFWGELPYPHYLFLNLIVEAGGGLEHKDSTVLMARRFRVGTREGYRAWLGLVSHELFHAWNVKRLRPVELGPFDYEREVYTTGLWVAEGITSYYDDLLVHRAGLIDRDEALEEMSNLIERLQTTPGRRLQSLERSSFDAWIKHYRRDESTPNTAVSYYVKGAVVAFLLDVEIRRATDDERSLDDAVRLAWERFSGERGFTAEGFRAVLEETAGRDLGPFLDRALTTTEELDYGPALEWLGLRFVTEAEQKGGSRQDAAPDAGDGEGDDGDEHPAAWLGAETEVDGGRLVVKTVPWDTPAAAAGVQTEDEIVALDGWRLPADGLEARLEALRPGHEGTLLVARRGRLVELAVTLGEVPEPAWRLAIDPQASEAQKRRLEAWLSGRRPD